MEFQKFGGIGTELSYRIEREEWNEYKLSDGSTLRIRPIIFKVFESNQMTLEGDPVIGYAATNITSVKVPEVLKEEIKQISGVDPEKRIQINFEPIIENWNVYKLENNITLSVRLIVSKVLRTSKMNQFGEPIYMVKSGNVADVEFGKDKQ